MYNRPYLVSDEEAEKRLIADIDGMIADVGRAIQADVRTTVHVWVDTGDHPLSLKRHAAFHWIVGEKDGLRDWYYMHLGQKRRVESMEFTARIPLEMYKLADSYFIADQIQKIKTDMIEGFFKRNAQYQRDMEEIKRMNEDRFRYGG